MCAMNVCCVTVTYGNRYHLLAKVVDGCIDAGVNKVIVVDNASTEESSKKIEELEKRQAGYIKHIRLDTNTGSAGGFRKGLVEAYGCQDCDFIWLLDDDNCPQKNALEILLDNYECLSEKQPKELLALLSLRENRKQFKRIADGYKVKNCFKLANSFLGFHIITAIQDVFKKIIKYDFSLHRVQVDLAVIPYAPYGGLFFNKKLLNEISYPDEKFFLYNDDTEFTYRITQNNGKIYLVSKSVINDIDDSWFINKQRKFYEVAYLFDGEDNRVFYAVRNRTYFNYHYLSSNKLIWHINKFVYLNMLRLIAWKANRMDRYKLIKNAVKDGINGELGVSISNST